MLLHLEPQPFFLQYPGSWIGDNHVFEFDSRHLDGILQVFYEDTFLLAHVVEGEKHH